MIKDELEGIKFDRPKEYRQDGTGELKIEQFEHFMTGQMIQFYQLPPSYLRKMNDLFGRLDHENEMERQEADKKGEKIRQRGAPVLTDQGLPVLVVKPEDRLRHPEKYSASNPDDDKKYQAVHHHTPNSSPTTPQPTFNENEVAYLDNEIHEWIKDRCHQYLQFLGIPYIGLRSSNSWVNDSEAGEYNPLHRHSGTPGYYKNPFNDYRQQIGLVILIALYIPLDMNHPGENEKDGFISGADRNGHTEWVFSSTTAQFCKPSQNIRLETGQVVVFPYDMFHLAYPHYNKEELRRTYSHNVDVFLEEARIA